MKPPHLLRVDTGPEPFAPLLTAARAAGLRLGWLDLTESPSPPATLGHAAAQGAFRAVAAGPERTVIVKPRRGPFVLRDLLREHFRGCQAVLVRGALDAPLLTPRESAWHLALPSPLTQSTEVLLNRLRHPHPWQD